MTKQHPSRESLRFLLVGPYDPHCGEYTFLAPPLGVWRLKGVLDAAGVATTVFDPNCCDDAPEQEFAELLEREDWDLVGVSTTGMTLQFDLALAHQARRAQPDALMIAGGMEATFKPDLMFDLGPFDLVALGEGEGPLLEIANRMTTGGDLNTVGGTALRDAQGKIVRHYQGALDPDQLCEAVYATPYEEMPYQRYWERLERAYRVGGLPMKADREARLAEIRSVRLNTLNYCPMGCTFCSSTNFLHAAKGGTARIRRLDAEQCMTMVRRIVAAHPDVRTIIFQDDIFVFTKDDRILPLCEMIVAGKAAGDLPGDLQFISTNRIDAMTPERLAAMKRAGFRVLGFGIENFSEEILVEFNKGRIFPYIEPNLTEALRLGITPFLDLILTSPRASLPEVARAFGEAWRWLQAGCEMGMYPYIIPFSGAAMAMDPELEPHTVYERRQVSGTTVEWEQPAKILPVDPIVRETILNIEREFKLMLNGLEKVTAHLPSRVRSLLWLLAAHPFLTEHGLDAPPRDEVRRYLLDRLPERDDPEVIRILHRSDVDVLASSGVAA